MADEAEKSAQAGHDNESAPGHEPTLDGQKLSLREVLGEAETRESVTRSTAALRRLLNNLSLFLAGMYTGESCAGTPHSERQKKQDTKGDDN